MEYDFYEIGQRITDIRKEKGMTQSELIKQLKDECGFSIGRNKLSEIETNNGKKKPAFSFEFLYNFAKLCDCDIGHLLGEYDEKKQEVHQICEYTGLNEYNVKFLNECKYQELMLTLNSILENRNFLAMLERIIEYRNINEKNNPDEAYLGDLDKIRRQKICEIWQLIEDITKDGANNG